MKYIFDQNAILKSLLCSAIAALSNNFSLVSSESGTDSSVSKS